MAEKNNGGKKASNWDKIKKEADAEAPASEKTAPEEKAASSEKPKKTEKAVKHPKTEAPKSPEKDQEAESGEEVVLTKAEADKIVEKYKELDDKYLHLLAEYDNFRKRAQKEREGVYADAYSEALSEFLPIADNLERATAYSDSAKVLEGVNITLKALTASLEKLGIEAFGEAGETFDPNLHNAIMHCEDGELGENVISEVFQRGYRKGDRIIRFAMVKVAN